MAAIGRLIVEIGAKTTLSEDLAKAQESLKAFGDKATKSGLSYLAAFEASLNPTKKLAEELTLLEKAGKSSSDIVAVLGDRIRTVSESAKSAGRPVDDIVKKYADISKEGENTGNIFARFGETLTQFAQHPLGDECLQCTVQQKFCWLLDSKNGQQNQPEDLFLDAKSKVTAVYALS